MTTIDRRTMLAGSIAALAVSALPAVAEAATATTYPLVPALPSPFTDRHRGQMILRIFRYDALLRNQPEDIDADAYRVVVARIRMALIFHQADALERMAAIARRYPPSVLRMRAVMEARLAGGDDWIAPWLSHPMVLRQ